jgi:hypothetical protein
MRKSSRAMASVVGLSLSLTACGGHGSPVTPGAGGSALTASSALQHPPAPLTPLVSVPHMTGALAFTDAGRRSSKAPVSITLTLRYNHQARVSLGAAIQ